MSEKEYSILKNSYGCAYCLMQGDRIIGAVSGNVAGFFEEDILPKLAKYKQQDKQLKALYKESDRLKSVIQLANDTLDQYKNTESELEQANKKLLAHIESLNPSIDKMNKMIEQALKKKDGCDE